MFCPTFLLTFGQCLANFERPVLGCIEEEEEFRSVFKKKENLGVCAKQKVRLTYFGKYYTLNSFAENSISLFRLPMSLCQQSIVKCIIIKSIVTTLASTNGHRFTSQYGSCQNAVQLGRQKNSSQDGDLIVFTHSKNTRKLR